MARARKNGAKADEPETQAPAGCCNGAIEVASEAADSVGESLEVARKVVRTRPFIACALSLGAGAIIGLLISR